MLQPRYYIPTVSSTRDLIPKMTLAFRMKKKQQWQLVVWK